MEWDALVVPELYSLKDGSPDDDYLSAINDYLRCNEHLDELNLEYLDDIDLEHDPEDNYPSDGYIEDNESSTDSQKFVDGSKEYVEETTKSSLQSDEEDYPPIFMNHHKESDVSEVDDDQDGMTDDSILKRRPEPTKTIPKHVGAVFHTFTLDDVKVAAWPQRIQYIYTWMVTKNLVEWEKYMILSEFTSRFSIILRDWWIAIGVADRNFFPTSQDFATNWNILLEVFCGDTGQRSEKLRRQLFEMKCISLDIHFQKMARIYFELGGDSNL
ncbi:hypothetical protein KY289_001086 [Solanum tuberosum]|nr:hypothetical protein KY289_001086 [Solanum tuberosum]